MKESNMQKKKLLQAGMRWNEDFDAYIEAQALRLNVSRTKLVVAAFRGLSETQLEQAVERGLKFINAERSEYFELRKVRREQIAAIPQEKLDALIAKGR